MVCNEPRPNWWWKYTHNNEIRDQSRPVGVLTRSYAPPTSRPSSCEDGWMRSGQAAALGEGRRSRRTTRGKTLVVAKRLGMKFIWSNWAWTENYGLQRTSQPRAFFDSIWKTGERGQSPVL